MNSYKIFKVFRLLLGLTFLCVYAFMLSGFFFLTFLAKIQFVPALLSLKNGVFLSLIIIMVYLVLTTLLGRIYCSFLCPFGFLMDLFVSWKRNFSFKKMNWLLTIFLIFVFMISVFSSAFILGLIDPYSLYGKVVSLLITPALVSINNGLHFLFPFIHNMRIYEISFWLLVIFVFYFALILSLSFIFGRFFCNFLCPVGAIFRCFSYKSFARLNIDKTKCIKCMRCEKVCPALCVNVKDVYIDYSRCLLCLRCLECPEKAIYFKTFFKNSHNRKEFFHITKSLLIFLFSTNKLFSLKDYKALRSLPSPPGSHSVEHLKRNCISCLLCISHCPSKVLKPSYNEYGIDGIFMPVMNYPKSFCLYECNACGRVCPTKAIQPFTLEEKKIIQIGKVKLVKKKCIVYRDKIDCGACSEVCPTKAVFMVEYEGRLFAPETETKYCVGCGACENVCPALPEKSIYIEGHSIHEKAMIRSQEKMQEQQDDFPF